VHGAARGAPKGNRNALKHGEFAAEAQRPDDLEYRLGLLGGIQGTWHRLWSAIATGYAFPKSESSDETIAAIRTEFEGLLGRALTAAEMSRLAAHAREHAERVLKPIVRRFGPDEPGA
jgi:hypothetical protein